MNDTEFTETLARTTGFRQRRAVERLRDGLFDPFGVRLLTAREDRLRRAFEAGLTEMEQNPPAHLCVCGAYGQGKSHSLTYLRQQALDAGFAVSQINLDPRETPFHLFGQVYRALVNQIEFPDGETSVVKAWKKWVTTEKSPETDPVDVIPDEMPHFFKSVLTALGRENLALSREKRKLKKHARFRPREFPWILANALNGESVPVVRLRPALKYRQVGFYNDASLACRGWEPYLAAVQAFPRLFQTMGFRGWVLLFDEGESIIQNRITARSKSYEILYHLLFPETPTPGLFSVFAFTDDFLLQVQQEEYDRVRVKNEEEIPYFQRDYGQVFRKLNVYRLQNLSAKEWKQISDRLIALHAGAYGWHPPESRAAEGMSQRLSETREQEARVRLKALVDQLDRIQQQEMLA